MRFPIGIQNFRTLREDGYLYIDKTELIYKLVDTGCYYLLSRPRRFGKSLLVSTLEAYFQGKKEQFKGLAMERLEKDWTARPVFHLDLNVGKYESTQSLLDTLNEALTVWEQEYGAAEAERNVGLRFKGVVQRAYEKTGHRVAILVDEYDKPLLQNIGNNELQEELRGILRLFYSVLKTQDRYIKFGLLTGVSKFSKLSVFSDLNNLEDISLNRNWASLCGITEEELHSGLKPAVELSAKLGVCLDTCHVNDAGYDIVHDLEGVLDEFDRVVGIDRLHAVHINDSKNPCGAHKDRHECIGKGYLGSEEFGGGMQVMQNTVSNDRLRELPFILETPNELAGYAAEINLLRSLQQ